MNKMILENYRRELLRRLSEKGRTTKETDAEKIDTFIMSNLDALVVATNGEGETDTTTDSEPVWGVNPKEEKKTSKTESYYLPLPIKRMVFNLLYPEGLITEPVMEDVAPNVVRVTASVYENPEMYKMGVPLGTFSKEYNLEDSDKNQWANGHSGDKVSQNQLRTEIISKSRGAVLSRVLGFGCGIGYELINTVIKTDAVPEETDSLVGVEEEKPKKKKFEKATVTEVKEVVGVGEDKKSMDEFTSFVETKPEPKTEEPVKEETPVGDVLETVISSCKTPSFNGKTIREIYESRKRAGMQFLYFNTQNSEEKKAVGNAIVLLAQSDFTINALKEEFGL